LSNFEDNPPVGFGLIPVESTAPPVAVARPSAEEVIAQHCGSIVKFLANLGVDGANVDDLAQDVCLAIHRKLGQFEGRSKITTWIYGICLRKVRDHRRRACNRLELATAAVPERSAEDNPMRDALRNEELAMVMRALDELSPGERQVFTLHEVEGYSVPEAAELSRCALRTAYARLTSAHDKIQAFFRRHGYEA
jgi:RNA polymerase sigma-70 factor (ECF subfamily)